MISILVLILLLAVVFVFRRKKKVPTDYYTLFIMGLIWFVIGLPFENNTLTLLGVAFMIAGLVNKDKWKKNHRPWSKTQNKERKFVIAIIILLALLFIAGVLAYYLYT